MYMISDKIKQELLEVKKLELAHDHDNADRLWQYYCRRDNLDGEVICSWSSETVTILICSSVVLTAVFSFIIAPLMFKLF